jgi:hypothetical protein
MLENLASECDETYMTTAHHQLKYTPNLSLNFIVLQLDMCQVERGLPSKGRTTFFCFRDKVSGEGSAEPLNASIISDRDSVDGVGEGIIGDARGELLSLRSIS